MEEKLKISREKITTEILTLLSHSDLPYDEAYYLICEIREKLVDARIEIVNKIPLEDIISEMK